MSFLTLLQNSFCPPLCLYVHHDCPGHFSRGSCWLLFRGEVGTSLAADCLLWPCCPDPSLGTTSERAGPPQAGLPHSRPGSTQLSHRKDPNIPATKGSDFQRLFHDQGFLIGSADVSLAHPLLLVSRCSSDLLRSARKPSQTAPSFWGHSFCLERGDARGEERNRERERGRGGERKEETRRGSERAWGGSAGFLTQRHILQVHHVQVGRVKTDWGSSLCSSLPWKAV